MTQANPDNIDITTLWRTLRRGLPRVLLLSLIIGGLTYLILSLMTPKYASEAEIAIVSKGATNPFTSPGTANATGEILSNPVDKEAINTHVRAIQSPDIALRVSNELHLNRLKEFNPILGPEDRVDAIMRTIGLGPGGARLSETDRVMKQFFKRLVVSSPRESRIISISFQSSDPDLAAKIANRIAEVYRKRLATAAVVETDDVQKALAPKIEKLTDEVANAEAEVVRFRVKAGLLRGGAQKTPLSDQQLGDLTTELTKAKAARAAAEAKAKNAAELMRRGTPEVIPEVQRSQLITQLIQQRVQVQRDLLKFSATMLDAHPVIRQLNGDLRAANRQIAKEVSNVVAGLEKEVTVAAQREASIKKSLDAIKKNVASESDDQVKLSSLEALAKSKRAELERLRAQYESNRARADSGAVPVEAQIVTRARASSIPASPRKGMSTALATVATFLFGLAWIVTKGLLEGARQPANRVEFAPNRRRVVQNASLPNDSVVTSNQNHPTQQAQPGAERQNESARSSSIAPPGQKNDETFISASSVADHLVQISAGAERGFRTLLVSDIDVTETATDVIELSQALSRSSSSILLIDWNHDNAGIAKALHLKTSPGIGELINYDSITFADVVTNLRGSGAHLIPSGAEGTLDPDNLNGEQVNLVLDALDEAYDHIVIVANPQDAKALFAAIGGRVDVGVMQGASFSDRDIADLRSNRFLGFEVKDIELFQWQAVPPSSRPTSAQPGRVMAPTRVR